MRNRIDDDNDNFNSWLALGDAIIVKAAQDYVKAKRVLARCNRDDEPIKVWKAERTLKDCQQFFTGELYQMLTDLDGEWVMHRLDEKV